MKKGCPYGTHRVISPKGVLPQPADVIDNNMEIYDNEVSDRCKDFEHRLRFLHRNR